MRNDAAAPKWSSSRAHGSPVARRSKPTKKRARSVRALNDSFGSDQKLGATLCSQHSIRACNVVMNGFLLSCMNVDAPELSLRISGEDPSSSASLGMR